MVYLTGHYGESQARSMNQGQLSLLIIIQPDPLILIQGYLSPDPVVFGLEFRSLLPNSTLLLFVVSPGCFFVGTGGKRVERWLLRMAAAIKILSGMATGMIQI